MFSSSSSKAGRENSEIETVTQPASKNEIKEKIGRTGQTKTIRLEKGLRGERAVERAVERERDQAELVKPLAP